MTKPKDRYEPGITREARTVDLATAKPAPTEEDILEEDHVNLDEERDYYFGAGEEWEPPRVVVPSTPGRDGVPYYDDDLDLDVHAAPREYPDWREGETFVISGTVGPGGRWASFGEGYKYAKGLHGIVLSKYGNHGKAYFRVYKPEFNPRNRN